MKFLEISSLALLNNFLAGVPSKAGDCTIDGRIECYSCKKAGSDKKLYHRLDQQYQIELSKSPDAEILATSPFGPLSESSSRKTFIELISILNASFPDYDFCNVKCEQFRKETSPYVIADSINAALASVLEDFNTLSPKIWAAIDEEIRIKECDMYTFVPDFDTDPYAEEGSVWSFNYFFKNRKLKRVLFFSCNACNGNSVPKSMTFGLETDEEGESEEEWTKDMEFE